MGLASFLMERTNQDHNRRGSPLLAISLGFGMPCPRIVFTKPGYMTLSNANFIFSPPNKGTESVQPVSAFNKGISTKTSKSSPCLLKIECFFSSIVKIISAGIHNTNPQGCTQALPQ